MYVCDADPSTLARHYIVELNNDVYLAAGQVYVAAKNMHGIGRERGRGGVHSWVGIMNCIPWALSHCLLSVAWVDT